MAETQGKPPAGQDTVKRRLGLVYGIPQLGVKRGLGIATRPGKLLHLREGAGRTIQMYLNIDTETIETAWPK